MAGVQGATSAAHGVPAGGRGTIAPRAGDVGRLVKGERTGAGG